MQILLASVAALALVTGGAHAQGHGNSHGNNGGGGGKPAAAQTHQGSGGGGNASHGAQKRASNSGDNSKHVAQAKPQAKHGNDSRGGGHASEVRPQTQPQKRAENREAHGNGAMNHANQDQPTHNQPAARAPVRHSADNGKRDVRVSNVQRDYEWLRRDRSRQPLTGCPPGLAKKHNGCNPPGQVKDSEVYRRTVYGNYYRPRLFGYTGYNSGDYYYRDGYLLRYNDNSIASWLPLLGGALGVGNIWPSSYQSYDVPQYYQNYYDLGGPGQYRYADDVMYRVNPGDGAITSIAGLITGDTFQVGQPMPPGYDVYNVPYGYRDRYYDTPDEMYRYSDGYIYQMDPTTRLIQAVISLLT